MKLESTSEDSTLSIQFGSRLPRHMELLRMARIEKGYQETCPSWEKLVDRWDHVTTAIKAASGDVGLESEDPSKVCYYGSGQVTYHFLPSNCQTK